MQDILVLGAGKIGALISGLLSESGDYRVQLADAKAGVAADVVFEAETSMASLLSYRRRGHYRAEHGEDGSVRKRHGRDGGELVLRRRRRGLHLLA